MAPDVELDRRSGLALELLDDLVDVAHALGRERGPVADAHDLVVGVELPALVRRAGVDRPADREQVVVLILAHVGADAAVLGVQEILVELLLELLGREEARVLVEAAHHPVDRGVDQVLALRDRLVGLERGRLDQADRRLDHRQVVVALELGRLDQLLGRILRRSDAPVGHAADAVHLQVGVGQGAVGIGHRGQALQLVTARLDVAHARQAERAEAAQPHVGGAQELEHQGARIALLGATPLDVQRDGAREAHVGRAIAVGHRVLELLRESHLAVVLDPLELAVGEEPGRAARDLVLLRLQEHAQPSRELVHVRLVAREPHGREQEHPALGQRLARGQHLLGHGIQGGAALLARGLFDRLRSAPDFFQRQSAGDLDALAEERLDIRHGVLGLDGSRGGEAERQQEGNQHGSGSRRNAVGIRGIGLARGVRCATRQRATHRTARSG